MSVGCLCFRWVCRDQFQICCIDILVSLSKSKRFPSIRVDSKWGALISHGEWMHGGWVRGEKDSRGKEFWFLCWCNGTAKSMGLKSDSNQKLFVCCWFRDNLLINMICTLKMVKCTLWKIIFQSSMLDWNIMFHFSLESIVFCNIMNVLMNLHITIPFKNFLLRCFEQT